MINVRYFETPLRKVYFADTDAAGVVHHSQYIRWFEAGRIDFLDELDCSYAALQKEGIGFVPVKINVAYRSPLRFGDSYRIRTAFVSIKPASLIIHSQIVSQDNVVCCDADVTLACMDERHWGIIKVPGKVRDAIACWG